jgi:hypothetical protein
MWHPIPLWPSNQSGCGSINIKPQANEKLSKNSMRSEKMRKEYDFSKGERGKYFREDAEFKLPVYLDEDNLSFVTKIAERKKADISEVVNELIRSDKRLAQLME